MHTLCLPACRSPCGHSICRVCLVSMLKRKEREKEYSCPLCKMSYKWSQLAAGAAEPAKAAERPNDLGAVNVRMLNAMAPSAALNEWQSAGARQPVALPSAIAAATLQSLPQLQHQQQQQGQPGQQPQPWIAQAQALVPGMPQVPMPLPGTQPASLIASALPGYAAAAGGGGGAHHTQHQQQMQPHQAALQVALPALASGASGSPLHPLVTAGLTHAPPHWKWRPDILSCADCPAFLSRRIPGADASSSGGGTISAVLNSLPGGARECSQTCGLRHSWTVAASLLRGPGGGVAICPHWAANGGNQAHPGLPCPSGAACAALHPVNPVAPFEGPAGVVLAFCADEASTVQYGGAGLKAQKLAGAAMAGGAGGGGGGFSGGGIVSAYGGFAGGGGAFNFSSLGGALPSAINSNNSNSAMPDALKPLATALDALGTGTAGGTPASPFTGGLAGFGAGGAGGGAGGTSGGFGFPPSGGNSSNTNNAGGGFGPNPFLATLNSNGFGGGATVGGANSGSSSSSGGSTSLGLSSLGGGFGAAFGSSFGADKSSGSMTQMVPPSSTQMLSASATPFTLPSFVATATAIPSPSNNTAIAGIGGSNQPGAQPQQSAAVPNATPKSAPAAGPAPPSSSIGIGFDLPVFKPIVPTSIGKPASAAVSTPGSTAAAASTAIADGPTAALPGSAPSSAGSNSSSSGSTSMGASGSNASTSVGKSPFGSAAASVAAAKPATAAAASSSSSAAGGGYSSSWVFTSGSGNESSGGAGTSISDSASDAVPPQSKSQQPPSQFAVDHRPGTGGTANSNYKGVKAPMTSGAGTSITEGPPLPPAAGSVLFHRAGASNASAASGTTATYGVGGAGTSTRTSAPASVISAVTRPSAAVNEDDEEGNTSAAGTSIQTSGPGSGLPLAPSSGPTLVVPVSLSAHAPGSAIARGPATLKPAALTSAAYSAATNAAAVASQISRSSHPRDGEKVKTYNGKVRKSGTREDSDCCRYRAEQACVYGSPCFNCVCHH